eukprot:CAMPEP_0177735632 /NCGR_PEP_ID=MMETSP0484_2-20121128/24880_1 /TAXON_ID=354590 /ORGANISM="Rhodomonas lens, Strain RHODO" /LENGTH=206 /DNA_ID=CAMNT_0019249209 /DNA_START=36 /DNA_END=652 /DNA_ORIENTATION=-
MSVFAFLGDKLLLRDDHFSFLVVEQTVIKVVPPLVAHGMSVLELLRVFVGVYPTVASHRRARLYGTLAQVLGPNDHLSTLILLLLGSAAGETEGSVPFCGVLCAPLPAETQVTVLRRLVEAVRAMPRTQSDLKKAKGTAYEGAASSMGSLRGLQRRAMDTVVHVLGGRVFTGLVQGDAAGEEGVLQAMLCELMGELVAAMDEVGGL